MTSQRQNASSAHSRNRWRSEPCPCIGRTPAQAPLPPRLFRKRKTPPASPAVRKRSPCPYRSSLSPDGFLVLPPTRHNRRSPQGAGRARPSTSIKNMHNVQICRVHAFSPPNGNQRLFFREHPTGKARATKKPGMTSIPGFRNGPGGGTPGRGERHDIMGRLCAWATHAAGRGILKVPEAVASRRSLEEESPRREDIPPQARLFAFPDLNLAGGGFLRFLAGNLDAQHAVLVGRGDLVDFGILGQG